MQMYVQSWQAYLIQHEQDTPTLTTNLIGFHWQMYSGHLQWLSDVFLIVFYKYDAAALRKLEMKYVGVITALGSHPCYNLPLHPHPRERPYLWQCNSECPNPKLRLARPMGCNLDSFGVRFLPNGCSSE